MHLIEAYSHFCGIKPNKPFIDEGYYPIQFDKYIVVQTKTGMATKDYDLWDEVCENINLPIVQLGGKDDPKISNALNLCGQTTWNQSATVIKNAQMFLGADSVCAHIASALGVPNIVLFGGTSPLSCGPYFNKDKSIVLNPTDRYGCDQPCHSAQCIRPKKCINSIKPEEVLGHMTSFLGQDAVKKVTTVHIGDLSKVNLLEWIPEEVGQAEFNTLSKLTLPVSIRGDLCPTNIANVSQVINAINNKFIVIVRPKDLRGLSAHPSKIEQLLIMVDKDNIDEGIRAMTDTIKKGYKSRLMSRLDHSEFNKHKLQMLDYPAIAKYADYAYKPEDVAKYVGNTYSVKSNKYVLGRRGNLYFTTHDALNQTNSVEINKNFDIKIVEDHLKELQFLTLRIYG